MATELSISNSALIKLGESPIVSLTQGTKPAKLCNARFASCRDAVYSKHPWRFLRKRKILAPQVLGTDFQFKNQFLLPSDCLRIYLVTDSSGDSVNDYLVENGKILSNDSAIYLNYIARITDISNMPEYLAECIAFYLAADIGYAITQISTVRDQMVQGFQMELRSARGIDSQSDAPRALYGDDFINSRFSSSSPHTFNQWF